MATPRGLVRSGAVAGSALLLSLSMASVAVADTEPETVVSLSVQSVPMHADESEGGIDASIRLGHNGHPDLPDSVTLETDASGAEGVLEVTVNGEDCAVTGHVTACEVSLPAESGEEVPVLDINLTVAEGADVGDIATITFTVFDEDTVLSEDTESVEIVGAPDLRLKDFMFEDEAAPGEVISYRPIVHNRGTATATFIDLTLEDTHYLRHAERFNNCRYVEHDGGTSMAHCSIEAHLAPGESMQVTEASAVELQVAPHVPHRSLVSALYWADPRSGPTSGEGELGDGPALALEKFVDDDFGDGSEFSASVAWPVGDNPADLEAIGATTSGAVGDTAVLEIGVTNHGPADVLGMEGLIPFEILVTFPDNVTVLEILRGEGDLQHIASCYPIVDGEPDLDRRNEVDGLEYWCIVADTISPDETWLLPFRIELANAGAAAGTVEVIGNPNDPDRSNNTAEIAVSVTPKELAVTGGQAALVGGIGVLSLVAGLALYMLARRQRIRLVSPKG